MRPLIFAILMAFAPNVAAQSLPFRILPAEQFCGNMIRSFAGTDLTQGDPNARLVQAQLAAQRMVALLRSGTLAHVIPVTQLGLETHTQERELRRYLSLEDVMRGAMGALSPYTLAFDADELRYIPYSLPSTQILLIVRQAGALNPERARLVAATAQRLKISLSVIWYGPMTEDGVREATGLAALAGMTGGSFVDLNHPSYCSRGMPEPS